MHPSLSPYLRVVKRGLWMFWAAALLGCDTSQWDPGAPDVLEVSTYTLITTPEQGTNSHRVEEVWVYGAADVLGVYPLPATIALPQGEPQTVTLVPGIRANGVAATRRPYRYYDVNTVILDGDPATVESVEFGGGYVDHSGLTTKVILAEDFESANRFVAGSNSNAEVIRQTEPDPVSYTHLTLPTICSV